MSYSENNVRILEYLEKTLIAQLKDTEELSSYQKSIASVQTVKFALSLVKSCMMYSENPDSSETITNIFDTINSKLNEVIKENLVVHQCEETERSYAEESMRSEKRPELSCKDDFSEESEDSGWASRFSDSENAEEQKEELIEDEDIAEVEEEECPLENLFVFDPERELCLPNIDDSKYLSFLKSLADKNIHTPVPYKLYDIILLYQDSAEHVEMIINAKIFKLLKEHDCSDLLKKLYRLDSC